MNFLYESTILLAEHFCHLKGNPIIAFSFINTLILNQKSKLSSFQMISLYELSQKYIYYIQAKEKLEKDYEISSNNNNLLVKNQRFEHYKNIFICLRISRKAKKMITYYIENLMRILKYKHVFEETLTFNFDENNESIIKVKINFFEQNSNIENNFNILFSNFYLLNCVFYEDIEILIQLKILK